MRIAIYVRKTSFDPTDRNPDDMGTQTKHIKEYERTPLSLSGFVLLMIKATALTDPAARNETIATQNKTIDALLEDFL
jgi:hypothetical protein